MHSDSMLDISTSCTAGMPPALGLTPQGQLHLGTQLVTPDCTSLAVRTEGRGGPFLLFTTRQHQLHSIPFRQLQAWLLDQARLKQEPGAADSR